MSGRGDIQPSGKHIHRAGTIQFALHLTPSGRANPNNTSHVKSVRPDGLIKRPAHSTGHFCGPSAQSIRQRMRKPVVFTGGSSPAISPYTFIPTAPLTFVTYFAEDFRNPAIVAEVEAHNMPWNKHCFAIVTPIKKDICGKEVLMLDGSIQGRWTVEEKVYETDMHAFIRIKDRRRQLLAVMAFPRHRVEMPTPSEFTHLFYERILKEPATTAHTQDITEPVLDGEETYIGERFVELS
ncbi:hypothetical protein DFH06DRAFT_1152996 [Mycena polygramma]|nr:hypothetical protein DFH06DRAFT_1152996 [Mycena polygramma]